MYSKYHPYFSPIPPLFNTKIPLIPLFNTKPLFFLKFLKSIVGVLDFHRDFTTPKKILIVAPIFLVLIDLLIHLSIY